VGGYTYLACDLLTDTPLAELPLRTVRLNLPFKGASGMLSAQLAVGTERVQAVDWLRATEPVRTFLWVYRGGLLVGGFMLWTRTYDPATRQLSVQGANLWSYFARRLLTAPAFGGDNVDQHTLVVSLLDYAQGKANGDVGLQPDRHASTIMRQRNWKGADLHVISTLIDQLSDVDRGPDFRLQVETVGGVRTKRLLLPPRGRYTLGASAATTGFVLAKPGAVVRYTWPEDGTQLRTTSTAALLEGGYPLLETGEQVDSDSPTVVVETVRAMQAAHSKVVVLPTVTCQAEAVVGRIWPGDAVRLQWRDERFPQGLDEAWRVLDIALAPTGASDLCTLTLGAT
jgi:hypothetical protein